MPSTSPSTTGTVSEPNYRSLQVEWLKHCAAVQQALSDLLVTQSKFETILHSVQGPGELWSGERDHLDRIVALDIERMSGEISSAETSEAFFLEDGSEPAPPLAPNHTENRSGLNATIQGTLNAFRESK